MFPLCRGALSWTCPWLILAPHEPAQLVRLGQLPVSPPVRKGDTVLTQGVTLFKVKQLSWPSHRAWRGRGCTC